MITYAKSSLQGVIMLILCSSVDRSGAAKPFTSGGLPVVPNLSSHMASLGALQQDVWRSPS